MPRCGDAVRVGSECRVAQRLPNRCRCRRLEMTNAILGCTAVEASACVDGDGRHALCPPHRENLDAGPASVASMARDQSGVGNVRVGSVALHATDGMVLSVDDGAAVPVKGGAKSDVHKQHARHGSVVGDSPKLLSFGRRLREDMMRVLARIRPPIQASPGPSGETARDLNFNLVRSAAPVVGSSDPSEPATTTSTAWPLLCKQRPLRTGWSTRRTDQAVMPARR